MLFNFIFRSTIEGDFCSWYKGKVEILLFLRNEYPVVPTPFVEKTYFSIELLWHLYWKSLDICVVLFLTSSSISLIVNVLIWSNSMNSLFYSKILHILAYHISFFVPLSPHRPNSFLSNHLLLSILTTSCLVRMAIIKRSTNNTCWRGCEEKGALLHCCTWVLSHVRLFAIPWIITCQAPLSMEFSRQEYLGGLPFPTPGDLPDPACTAGRNVNWYSYYGECVEIP